MFALLFENIQFFSRRKINGMNETLISVTFRREVSK